jgi:SagB-type dehydrogenase family enzyme
MVGLRASGMKKPSTVSARLGSHVTLDARADRKMVACFGGYSLGLGTFSADTVDRAQKLYTGLPLASFASRGRSIDKETDLLVRRLAQHGLLEYRLPSPETDDDQVVIEPQMPDYWPRALPLDDADVVALSRFAYLRRRGNDLVLESPRASALFKICDPRIASALATLAAPQNIKKFRQQGAFPGLELLALLVECGILFKIEPSADSGLRPAEGDSNLVLWDFHDLLFHARSTQGRHANPLGGVYPYAGVIPPPSAVRPRWPGKKNDLGSFPDAGSEAISPFSRLLRERHSTRSFDDERPITFGELARFLDGTARVLARYRNRADLGDAGPWVDYAIRPYPSAGASYALELYLAVDKCDGLVRGFYHYDADGHELVPISVATQELEALLTGAAYAMGAPARPQVLITIAARFGRTSWKYSSIAYALILKDVGVLTQTLYLVATDMGLGGCAIGTADIHLFAKMTGIEFHIEGPVGQFAIGRASKFEASDSSANEHQ